MAAKVGRTSRTLLLLIAGTMILMACRDPLANESAVPQNLVPEILAIYPHDPKAFTQGLLYHQGYLYESTGLYGLSELRKIELATGKVLRRTRLEAHFFGEGLALAGNRLIQLTWGENTAFVYDRETFTPIKSYTYKGEGWGLCFDGLHLYRSDGSSTLYLHSLHTFEVVGTLSVSLQGRSVADLNELACVGPHIYANVFQTDYIVRIDKQNGRVTARIKAETLLSPQERAALPVGATLNGIAHDSAEDVFFLTGKLWPKLFKVRFR